MNNRFRSAILGGGGIPPATPLVAEKNGGTARSDELTSVGILRDAARSADHREGDRHRLARETAVIGFRGKMFDADLINLSGGGAMIEVDLEPRLWDRIDLYLGAGSPIECAVRWLRNGRIGLEFAHETQLECDEAKRDALLIDVINRSFPDLKPSGPAVEREPEPQAEAEVATLDEAAAASRRAAIRHPLIWNGTICFNHDEHVVRLRNISASGVLIDAPTELPEGAELYLDLGAAGQYFATVGWSRGGQAGLVFASPFDLSKLAASRPTVAPQRWARPSYLDLSSSQASPWDSGWERSDLADLRSDLEGFLKR